MIIDLLLNLPPDFELQKISQSVLESGWLFLLPSADERANTLCGLLRSKKGISCFYKDLEFKNFFNRSLLCRFPSKT